MWLINMYNNDQNTSINVKICSKLSQWWIECIQLQTQNNELANIKLIDWVGVDLVNNDNPIKSEWVYMYMFIVVWIIRVIQSSFKLYGTKINYQNTSKNIVTHTHTHRPTNTWSNTKQNKSKDEKQKTRTHKVKQKR